MKPTDPQNQLRRALVAMEKAQTKIDALERAKNEPIAIVGMGCRFPGGGDGPRAFFQALVSGVDGVREIPEDRWPKSRVDDAMELPSAAVRWAGLLESVDTFDPAFFSIAPREAIALDPQQRLLLEVTWEALEDAAIAPAALEGSATGVFVGLSSAEYLRRMEGAEGASFDASWLTGNLMSVAAGRLSFALGLQGPAVALDTACSSSLVAVHLACQSLRTGESSLAVAGGVSLILAPQIMAAVASAVGLSPDGRCRTFDAEARGYVRGEGCGIVILKRLSDALRDGDHVRAIIRGSAVNQDGRSMQLTVPNALAQQALLRQALASARVAPHEIGYVETHGTGTPLGDPLEFEVLRDVLGAPRPYPSRCVLGAVKTNIGHLEAASGAASIVKAVLALEQEVVPANLHFRTLNPHISLDGTPFVIPTKPVPWPRGDTPRRAGVSAFGISGTNAHLVLEEAPRDARTDATSGAESGADVERPLQLLVLSAKSDRALRALALRWVGALDDASERFADLCHTAGVGRNHFERRVAIVARSAIEARDQLANWLDGSAPSRCFASHDGARAGRPRVAFLFGGDGSQVAGMGRDLYATQPVFRAALDRCAELLKDALPKPLIEVMFTDGDALRTSQFAQPAIFALTYALYETLRAWGVSPDVVLGYGVGEVAAACAAGVMSLEDALAFVAARGRLSSRVESVRDELGRAAAKMVLARPVLPLVSTVSCTLAGEEVTHPAYWVRQACEPVRFEDGMKTLGGLRIDAYVEIGPTLAEGAAAAGAGSLLPTLRTETEAWPVLLESLARLYVQGANIDWRAFDAAYTRRRMVAPTYAWDRGRYWASARSVVGRGPNGAERAQPGRLSGPTIVALGDTLLSTVRVGVKRQSYLADHSVHGRTVVPAAFYVAILLAIASDHLGARAATLRDVRFRRPLWLEQDVDLNVELRPGRDGVHSFSVSTGEDGSRRLHAEGELLTSAAPSGVAPLDSIREAATNQLSVVDFVDSLRAQDLAWGPAWCWLAEARTGAEGALVRITPPVDVPRNEAPLHPILIDNAFAAAALAADGDLSAGATKAPRLPQAIDELRWYGEPAAACICHAKSRAVGDDALSSELRVLDDTGRVLLAIDGLSSRSTTKSAFLELGQGPIETQETAADPAPSADRRDVPVTSPSRLAAMSPAARTRELEAVVRAEIARVLRLPLDQVPLERPLTELGLNSLMSVEIANRLRVATGRHLRFSDVVRGASAAELAASLADASASRVPSSDFAPAANDEIVFTPVQWTAEELLAELETRGATIARAGDTLRVRAAALDDTLRNAIAMHKAALLEHLVHAGDPAIGVTEATASPRQHGLWFLHQTLERPETYNVHVALRVARCLDRAVLAASLAHVNEQHEQLRACVVPGRSGVVRTRVLSAVQADISEHDLSALPADAQDVALHELSQAEARRPFDLSRPPLLRAALVGLGARGSALLITWHHIVTDGWSVNVFLRDLFEAYEACSAGQAPAFAPSPSPLAYVERLRAWLATDEATAHREWWRVELAGLLPLELAVDRPPPSPRTSRGGQVTLALTTTLSDAIDTLARTTATTPFVVLLAALSVVLHRTSGQTEFSVGTVVAARDEPGFEEAIGFFVNTLPVRCDLGGTPTIAEAIARTRERVAGVLAHQRLPYEEIVRVASSSRGFDAGENPLFRALFVLEDGSALGASREVELIGASVSGDVDGTAKFDLVLALMRTTGGYSGSMSYSADLFDAPAVERLAGHLLRVLEAFVANPAQAASALPLLGESEERRILVDWNETAVARPSNASIAELFEARVAERPGAVAAVFEGASLTYAELDARAERLADRLRVLGAGPETRIGLSVERSLEMVIGLVGIAKTGAAYVPLDPALPPKRLDFMIEDCAADAIVTQASLRERFRSLGDRVVLVDDLEAGAAARSAPRHFDVDRLAYVIYTSGSTGQPKGVLVTHRGLTNVLLAFQSLVRMEPADVLFAVSTLSFDMAGLEIWLPLITGARVVIAPATVAVDGAALRDRLRSCEATVVLATPTTWRLLFESGWEGADRMRAIAGAEALAPDLADRLVRVTARAYNAYGPTETTICSTIKELALGERPVSIGRPVANTRVYVLDARMQPVPIGVPGELWIGGVGVSRGYHARPDLTGERFVPSPFGGHEERLYRTGDRVRWLTNGELEYLGRLDQQVKIRGFRIELGEIEAVLAQHPSVSSAVVTAWPDKHGGHGLLAYVVEHAAVTDAELRDHLRTSVPAYMMPSAFVRLDALPLMSSGKVDRKALPPPAPTGEGGAEYVAPETGSEELVAAIWRDVMGISRIGRHDSFFELGGHSLLAIKAQRLLSERVGREVPIVTLFRHPTIASLAAHLDGQAPQATPVDDARERVQLRRQLVATRRRR